MPVARRAAGSSAGQQRAARGLHGARRQAVGDDEGDIVCAGMRRSARFGVMAASRRPRSGRMQIVLPVAGGASATAAREAETRRLRRARFGVERRMHGVAGAGVGQPEIEQRRGGERCAGSAQPDAGAAVSPAQVGARGRIVAS